MRLVLDSSIGVKAVLPETDSAKAIALLDDFKNKVHELIAPDVFPIEIAHALTRAERKGLIKPPEAMALFSGISNALPELHSSLPLLGRAIELSSTMRHGVYDCLYLALSEREGCDLVTADEKLAKNFPTMSIVTLSSL